MITWVKDKDLYDDVGLFDIVLVGTNLYCTMSHGLQLQVMLNYPYVYNANLKTKYGDREKIGTILECAEANEPTFCLCFITEGYNFRPDLQKDFLNYEALAKCLRLVNIKYEGKKIGTPLLGISPFEGNGERDKIINIFEDNLKNVDAYVYDYQQKSRAEMIKEFYVAEKAVRNRNDYKTYYKMVAERKRKAEERFRKNGHRRY